MIAAKWVQLDEIIGHLKEEKEEEPEGEVLGNSDTGSLLFPPLLFFFILILLMNSIFISGCTASFIFRNFPLQMTPKREMGKKEGQ